MGTALRMPRPGMSRRGKASLECPAGEDSSPAGPGQPEASPARELRVTSQRDQGGQ